MESVKRICKTTGEESMLSLKDAMTKIMHNYNREDLVKDYLQRGLEVETPFAIYKLEKKQTSNQ